MTIDKDAFRREGGGAGGGQGNVGTEFSRIAFEGIIAWLDLLRTIKNIISTKNAAKHSNYPTTKSSWEKGRSIWCLAKLECEDQRGSTGAKYGYVYVPHDHCWIPGEVS